MNVKNITNNKGNVVKNQFILTDYNKVVFQSYDSKVATFEDGKLILNGATWDYSNTTRKYFKEFVNNYTPYIYENKAQWLKLIKECPLIEVV
jgi:hypothetical protein